MLRAASLLVPFVSFHPRPLLPTPQHVCILYRRCRRPTFSAHLAQDTLTHSAQADTGIRRARRPPLCRHLCPNIDKDRTILHQETFTQPYDLNNKVETALHPALNTVYAGPLWPA